ncbi:MAG: 16S rRNA (cytidine(1402)-2'-O)-methyltransferase [Gammaproteobacteria bacterium]|nr:16S rRNA (cytidine(1402)-2'-O)-methyltransferase [Gammaproteobacteria bacterium]MDH3466108.1 16S rRNA (cytidine(1402)-2'-O)-methyltransferase [Gammaproteobacteria bacterium]
MIGESASKTRGCLFIVATPIGNLRDVSYRAIDVLAQADLVLVEDTRHSRRLFNHYKLAPRLLSLHEHNERQRIATVTTHIDSGARVALVSDAGTPLISDPGFALVKAMRDIGIQVIPIPGPNAAIAALSVAGLPTDRFAFEGFLPARAPARRECLGQLANEQRTLVFYESGRRVAALLDDIALIFDPDRMLSIAREMTKRFEEFFTGNVSAGLAWFGAQSQRAKGEFVVVVQGCPHDNRVGPRETKVLRRLLDSLSVKQSVAIAADLTGCRKQELYRLALTLRDADD